MSRADLERLVEQLETLRAATDRYQDVEAAVADGYVKVTDEVPNMGAHYQHQGYIDDGIFNLEEPEGRHYVKDTADEWQLRGTFFLLPREAVGDMHPDTFAGPLDNWHMHYSLCVPEVALLDGCEMSGGIPVQSSPWMVHAWVRDDNPWVCSTCGTPTYRLSPTRTVSGVTVTGQFRWPSPALSPLRSPTSTFPPSR